MDNLDKFKIEIDNFDKTKQKYILKFLNAVVNFIPANNDSKEFNIIGYISDFKKYDLKTEHYIGEYRDIISRVLPSLLELSIAEKNSKLKRKKEEEKDKIPNKDKDSYKEYISKINRKYKKLKEEGIFVEGDVDDSLLEDLKKFRDYIKNNVNSNSNTCQNQNSQANNQVNIKPFFIKFKDERFLNINKNSIDILPQGSFSNQTIILREIFKEDEKYISTSDLLEKTGWIDSGNSEANWQKIKNAIYQINKKVENEANLKTFIRTQSKTEIFINKDYL